MPRRPNFKKISPTPDELFGSLLISRLINRSMLAGKKSVAQKQVYQAFNLVKKETKKDPLGVFNQAMDNIRPRTEVRSRRLGGAAYQVPTPVRGSRQDSLAIRWLILNARSRPNKTYHTYAEKLAAEIIDAANGTGAAVSKREEIERIAEANKAFSHLRW